MLFFKSRITLKERAMNLLDMDSFRKQIIQCPAMCVFSMQTG